MQIGASSLSPLPSRVASIPASPAPAVEQALAGQGTAASSISGPASPSETSGSADDSAQRQGQALVDKTDRAQQRLEQLEVAELASTDQEVRAHEQAHAAVGGVYAGAPSYTYTRGPDGKRYAVAGEVSIDTGSVSGDPEATLRKMQVVISAALAPAEPSAQDRQVAAQAQVKMAQARVELAAQQRQEDVREPDSEPDSDPDSDKERADTDSESATEGPSANALAGLAIYQQIGSPPSTAAQLDLSA